MGGGGFYVGGGGFFVGGDGNKAVAFFFLFPIWILCKWWWVVLVLSGGG